MQEVPLISEKPPKSPILETSMTSPMDAFSHHRFRRRITKTLATFVFIATFIGFWYCAYLNAARSYFLAPTALGNNKLDQSIMFLPGGGFTGTGTAPEEDFISQWPFNYTSDGDDVVGDPKLVEFLRRWILVPPPSPRIVLAPGNPRWDPSAEGIMSSSIIPKYLSTIRNGVFFEAGALDGETLSNTWYLEKNLGWTGLLAEMNPWNVRKVLRKDRKAWFAPVCLSPVGKPTRVKMNVIYNPKRLHTTWGSTISSKKWAKNLATFVKRNKQLPKYSTIVDCFPLQTILLASNLTKIDFFSLDVEGVELQVLQTLWWDKLEIKVMFMDLLHTEEGADAVKDFLATKGFVVAEGGSDQVVFISLKHLRDLKSASKWEGSQA